MYYILNFTARSIFMTLPMQTIFKKIQSCVRRCHNCYTIVRLQLATFANQFSPERPSFSYSCSIRDHSLHYYLLTSAFLLSNRWEVAPTGIFPLHIYSYMLFLIICIITLCNFIGQMYMHTISNHFDFTLCKYRYIFFFLEFRPK